MPKTEPGEDDSTMQEDDSLLLYDTSDLKTEEELDMDINTEELSNGDSDVDKCVIKKKTAKCRSDKSATKSKQCDLCGKSFLKLRKHIRQQHNTDNHQFRKEIKSTFPSRYPTSISIGLHTA